MKPSKNLFNPNSAIGFGRISQRLRAAAHWTLPRRTLWCVERKGQCADAEGFAKGVPNAIAESGFNLPSASFRRLLAAAALLVSAHEAGGATYNWVSSSDNRWGVPANWSSPDGGLFFPQQAGDVAVFDLGTHMSLDGRTIALSNNYTLGTLRAIGMDEAGDFYRLAVGAPGWSLYLDRGDTGPATIEVFAKASLTVAPNIALRGASSHLYLHNHSQLGGELTISGSITATGKYVLAEAQYGSVITLAGQVNAGSLRKSGMGILRLTGNSNYQDFYFNGGVVDLSNATGSQSLGRMSSNPLNPNGGTLYVGYNSQYGNTILIENTTREAAVASVEFAADASLTVGRRDGFAEDKRPQFVFSGQVFKLANGGNTLAVTLLTELVIKNQITGGALTKTDSGTLILENTGSDINGNALLNTFNGLNIIAGKVSARGTAGSTVEVGAAASLVGGGPVVISGATSHLEITSYTDASHPGNTLAAVNFGNNANLSLDNLATFSITRTQNVNFNAGVINLNGYGNRIVVDAAATLGGTTFANAGNAVFVLKRDTLFTDASGIPATGMKFEFAPDAGVTQNITRSSAGNLVFAGAVLVSGAGVTNLDAGILSLSSGGGLGIAGGTLALNAAKQINPNTPVTFENVAAAAPGTIRLNGHDQIFDFVQVKAGGTGVFDLGVGASTRLQINNFDGDTLRVSNWRAGNQVREVPSFAAADVWFYGYEKGAQVDGAGNFVPGSTPRLSASFDNTRDGFAIASDWKWFNPVNWVGDDYFKIPNAPGVTASIKNNTGATGIIKEKTISLGANETTVGILETFVGNSTDNINGMGLTFSGENGAKLIFDSGAPGVAAKWNATTEYNSSDATIINVPVVLNSDLEVNNTVGISRFASDRFKGVVSGAGKIIKNGTGKLSFLTAGTFTGGVVLNRGYILINADNALGTGPIEINNTGTAVWDAGLGSYSSTERKILDNEIIIKGDFIAAALVFRHPTLKLDKVYEMDVDSLTLTSVKPFWSWHSPSVVIESQVTGAGGFIISGHDSEWTDPFMRFDNPNNNFTGGLEAGFYGHVSAIVGTGQTAGNYGMVVGAQEAGKNYFGPGSLTFSGEHGRFTIVTGEGGKDVEVRGDGVSNTITGSNGAGFFRFMGRGEANITANAKIVLTAGEMIFAAAKNTVSGGVFDLSGTGSLVFTDNKYNVFDGATGTWGMAENTAVAANVVSGGVFNLSENSSINFLAAGANANTISGGVFNLNDTGVRFHVGDKAETGGTPSYIERIVHFTGGVIKTDATNRGSLVLGNGGFWSFEGGQSDPNLLLEFNTQSTAGIRAGGSGNGDLEFHTVVKNNNGLAVIENTVTSLRASGYFINGGTLRATRASQLLGASGGAGKASLQIAGGGTLDIDGLNAALGELTVGAGGGSFRLGASGSIEFDSLKSWGDSADPNPVFSIQGNGGGSWDSKNAPNFVAFGVNPGLSSEKLKNIVFSGYESGAVVSTDGNFYFLKPADDAIFTSEWTGNPNASFTGVKWSEAENWFSVGGSGAVPGTSGGLNSATFRDIDARLGEDVAGVSGNNNGKKILVDGDYSLAHLNIETAARKFEINAGGGRLVFENAGAVSAQIKHTGLSTLVINAPVVLNSVTQLVLGAKRTDGQVILAGQISGAGGFVKTGGGDLRVTGYNNTFTGGFTWDDNAGHLQIRHENTAADATPLGAGLVTFGSSASSVTRVEGSTSAAHRVNTPGGFLLNGGIVLENPSELGREQSAATNFLHIDASSSDTGILLAPGEHVIGGAAGAKHLYLFGTVHDQTPGKPASLTLNPEGRSLSLYLNGDNDFSGGIIITGGMNDKNIYIGHDHALGTGSVIVAGAFAAFHAAKADGSLLTEAGAARRITNPLVFSSYATRATHLYGNLILDREQGETWTVNTGVVGTLSIAPHAAGTITENTSFGKTGPAFGENLVISGTGKLQLSIGPYHYHLRLLGAGNTYSGGTTIVGNTINDRLHLTLGADSVMNENGSALKSGPLGTGAVTINAALTFIPWSTDPNKTARTISNEIKPGGTTVLGVMKTTESENYADTVIFNSAKPFALTKALTFNTGAGAVLQIDSQVTGAHGITKIGAGAVVLSNAANSFVRAEVTGGALVARAGTPVLIAPPGAAGRAGHFGTGAPAAFENNAFDVQANNYANGRASLVVETPDIVTVSSGAGGAQPFYLVGRGAAFIVGGSANGEGMGYKGAGKLRLGDNSEIHGRSATVAAEAPGWLVADRILKDTPGVTGIGLNLRANSLDISGNGTLSLRAPNLLSGVAGLHFSGDGILDLGEYSQALRADSGAGATESRHATLGASAGVNGHIRLTSNGKLAPDAPPILFTFGRVADDNAGAVHFDNWQGSQDTGLGPTRVITTGHRRGELVPNVWLDTPDGGGTSGVALVMLNSDGQNVLIPLNDMLIWYGSAMSARPVGAHWEQIYTPPQGTTLSNWLDTKAPGSARWPGAAGLVQDAARVVTFLTSITPEKTPEGAEAWTWGDLTVPITTDGFTANDPAEHAAVGGSILIYGSNNNAQITLASGANMLGAATSPRLTLNNGVSENVSFLLSVNARLRVNLPIYLVSDSSGSGLHNNLIINTAHADSVVELNETVTGSLGSILYKNGAGHLFLRGDNDPAALPGLSGGLVVEGGHLYLGNPKSVGSLADGARLTFRSGTVHPVEDWYVPASGAGSTYKPPSYNYTPDPASPRYADLEIANNYRFAGEANIAGGVELAFRNKLGQNGSSTVTGEVTANSTVTILDKNGKLVLDGTTLGTADGAGYDLAFTGPGSALVRKSGDITRVNLVAAATAADVAAAGGAATPPLVEIAAKTINATVTNSGHGALKLSDYAATGGGATYGAVSNLGPGTLEIATTGRTYTAGVQNTGAGVSRVTGANNAFIGGITSAGGGSFVLEAAATARGNLTVSGNSLLHLKAPLADGGGGSISASVGTGGRIRLDASVSPAFTGSLKTGSTGSVTVNTGGVLEFIIAQDGRHGVLTTEILLARSGGELQVAYNKNFDASEFTLGYTLNLFDSYGANSDFVPGAFRDEAGWFHGQNIYITQDGNTIKLDNELAWRFDHLATTGEIYIGERIPSGLYWDGTAAKNTWDTDPANTNWRSKTFYDSTRAATAAASGNLAFTEGERVIFDRRLGNAPTEEDQALDVVLANGGKALPVHSMLIVGQGSDFTFSGDAIEVVGPYYDDDSEYAGIPVGIVVANQADTTFRNAVKSPFLKIENNATATLVYTVGDTGIGGDGKFNFANGIEVSGIGDTLVIKQEDNTPDASNVFKSVVSGRGNLEKTGPGTIVFEHGQTYNGVVSINGEIVGGATRVKEGKLVVSLGLGNGGTEFSFTDSDGDPAISDRNYIGAIEVSPGAILRFTGQITGDGQRLGGHIGHGYGSVGADGHTHAPSADGTIEFNGGYYEIAAEHNSFQGKLVVGEDKNTAVTHLNISGGLGVIAETFDGGTAFEKTYYHARYAGDVYIAKNGVLEFSYKGDYQHVSGALTGSGELRINGGMPFYYTGDAGEFAGVTAIQSGSFHLTVPAGSRYGSGSDAGQQFKVKSGAALYVGGGGKIYTRDFAMEANTTLVVNPGKFAIQTAESSRLKFGENTGENVVFSFRVAPEDLDTEANPNPKLTLQSNAPIVLSPGKTLRVDSFGYIPQPSQDGHFTLMSGLDVDAMMAIANVSLDKLALAVFNNEELDLLNSRFKVYFTSNGELMLGQVSFTNVPEPTTYALFGAAVLCGLACFHRRRRLKSMKVD